jgi:hypothetical protein
LALTTWSVRPPPDSCLAKMKQPDQRVVSSCKAPL